MKIFLFQASKIGIVVSFLKFKHPGTLTKVSFLRDFLLNHWEYVFPFFSIFKRDIL